jgi:transposase
LDGDLVDDGLVIAKEELRSAHKSARKVRSEVLAGPERRRRWSVEEKLRILGQSTAPGSSVSLVCRMHGISSGQLCTWRKQFRTGELTGFAPVTVLANAAVGQRRPPVVATDSAAPVIPTESSAAAMIEIELLSGIRLRLTGDVAEVALRRVLSALS